MKLFSKPEEEFPGDPRLRILSIGPLWAERDCITVKFGKHIYYNINISWPDYGYDNLVVGDEATWHTPDGEELVNMGPGKRLEFTIWPLGHWLIGLEKKNKFKQWSWHTGYRNDNKPRHFTWRPPRSWECQNLTGERNNICGAFKYHKCPYRIREVDGEQ